MREVVVKVSKAKVRRLLELYTIEGFTQQESGEIVFAKQNLKGLSPAVVAQRIFHYLGVNMEYRSDYLHSGLDSDIIESILSNKLIAFPLLVPVGRTMPHTLNFDQSLKVALEARERNHKGKEKLKSVLAFVVLILLQYMLYSQSAWLWIPMCLYFFGILAVNSLREGEKIGEFIGSNIIVLLFLVFIVVMAFTNS